MNYPYSLDSTLSILIQANLQYIICTDVNGNISFCNNKSLEQLQLQDCLYNSEIKLTSFLSEQDKIAYTRATRECMEDISQSVSFSLRSFAGINFAQGLQFVVSAISNAAFDQVGFLLIGQETSKQITKEATTNTSNNTIPYQELKAIVEQNQNMIWVLDREQNCVYANEVIFENFNTSPSKEFGKAYLNRFKKTEFPETFDLLEKKLSEEKEFSLEVSVFHCRGHKIWLQLKAIPKISKNEEFDGYILYGTDITVIHEAAASMKKQSELISVLNKEYSKFKKIINASSQCIMIANTINQITWVNEAVTNTMGYTSTEAVGRQDFQLFCGEETNNNDISHIKSSVCDISSLRKEMLLYKKNGQKTWVEFIKEPIFDENNIFSGFFIILNDIQIKKVSEKETAKQMISLKKMSFIASHEIRHEFSKIMQVTQTIKYQHPDLETYSKLLDEIEKSTQKMNTAIYELNDQINFATSNTISLDAFLNQDIEEVVLIDDDKLVNQMNQLVVKSIYPTLDIKVFDDVEYALSHINANPETKRKIIVDLNFPHKSGWYFLDEYKKLHQPWPVVILTSSLEKEDIDLSKSYQFITHYMTKPMNVEQLKTLNIIPSKKLQVA
ncbi:MAG: PAS domain-containing protein [Chitinophagaceae bacterium]|nr:PAS domain-containing protein [Chitinophagaceae bacterium]